VDHLQAHRTYFAQLITAAAGVAAREGGLVAAFAATARERFVGPGPWRAFTPVGYITTPSDDPAFLYHDVAVALTAEGGINNGQPVLHAICLAALSPQAGETVVHVGAGTGYYSAILANLVGPTGSVIAYEIDLDLARRAKDNLADLPNVTVRHASGSEGALPECDVVYVNAGATAPLDAWLDPLRLGGRLLFPLTPAEVGGRPAPGAMLLVNRGPAERWGARFVCPAAFIPCAGARDDETAKKLSEAFRRGDSRNVRSLRRGEPPDETSWMSGNGWWLSTASSAP
jgi:protein-L-isoaspartate(D-aspartate) O-methyltransferase